MQFSYTHFPTDETGIVFARVSCHGSHEPRASATCEFKIGSDIINTPISNKGSVRACMPPLMTGDAPAINESGVYSR